MIEEPYRWVEAVETRREYIETQLAPGSPIAAVSCAEGIVLVAVGRARQKLFEIYDRIAMGAIGHPGDIERLRMAAIELASTEGFTRSAADVSLRRLAFYSLSPVLKAAFEQVYGAPYLARLLFAEVGEHRGRGYVSSASSTMVRLRPMARVVGGRAAILRGAERNASVHRIDGIIPAEGIRARSNATSRALARSRCLDDRFSCARRSGVRMTCQTKERLPMSGISSWKAVRLKPCCWSAIRSCRSDTAR
ncbi:MAG: hypothetical protein WKF47_06095 [Geodermatophilaceae bacterium]